MWQPTMERSTSIQSYYADKTILITGATGFVGSYLVEKLLRSCPDVRRIYLLIRSKRRKDSESRLEEFLSDAIHNGLKQSNPSVLKKLAVITGDLELPRLGLSEVDEEKIVKEVNCIFHVGATVKFTEELRRAILINIGGTDSLIEIAKKIEDLKSFVHVSTAYSQCIRDIADEAFYVPEENYTDLITMANTISNEKLNEMTPTILGKWPNTYSFTKNIAEDLVRKKGTGLPMVIVRPSIVIAPYREPTTGWASSYDLTSLLVATINVGVVHTMCCDPKHVVDLVPVDFCVNQAIAAGWAVGREWSRMSKIPIYNFVSGPRNPITWGLQKDVLERSESALPSNRKIFHRYVLYGTNKKMLDLVELFYLPLMYIVNLKSFFLGKVHITLKTHRKIREFCKVVEFASCKEWYFKDDNTQNLWNLLEEEDRDVFCFDINSIDWQTFSDRITKGVRLYILKDDLSTVGRARTRSRLLKILQYFVVSAYVLLPLYIVHRLGTIIL
ncbi:putative fatty acyl-CoA reductase CG5065 isoform X2 [Photinus pyralis]|uniref:putative fatty acyl-CoA reductase CG5065 isoform X2 n=1 Tax=Photinus pyralis TaxID=7054 RepID=UPI00126769A6|nr:putative fatty acyl-CoA reductase CG5065 isoform X2 [Photinus pyralis]